MPRLLTALLAALAPPPGLRPPAPPKGPIIHGPDHHDWKATPPHLKAVLESCGRFAVDVATAPVRPQLPRNPNEEDRRKFADAQPLYQQQMAAFRPPIEGFQAVLLNYN